MSQEVAVAAVREERRQIGPDLPLYNVRSMEDILSRRSFAEQIFGTLFAAFAAIALLISSVGIYAMTAYRVGQRTQEIGVRMALGAGRRDILWLVLRQGVARIALGSVLGLAAALGIGRILQAGLTKVTASDPMTYVTIFSVLAAVTLLACFAPARPPRGLTPADRHRAFAASCAATRSK